MKQYASSNQIQGYLTKESRDNGRRDRSAHHEGKGNFANREVKHFKLRKESLRFSDADWSDCE